MNTCLVHTNPNVVERLVRKWAIEGKPIDLRRTPLDQATVDLVTAAGRDGTSVALDCRECQPVGAIVWADLHIKTADFGEAVTTASMRFTNVVLDAELGFRDAKLGSLMLDGITGGSRIVLADATANAVKIIDHDGAGIDARRIVVEGAVEAQSSTFRHSLSFTGARIGKLDLSGCTIKAGLNTFDAVVGRLTLNATTVAGRASLAVKTVSGDASVQAARVTGRLHVGGAFERSLDLGNTTCGRGIRFSRLTVARDLNLPRVTVTEIVQTGKITVGGDVNARALQVTEGRCELRIAETSSVDVSHARFGAACAITATCGCFTAQETTFTSRSELWLSGDCSADMQGAEFRERALVDGDGTTDVVDLRRARCDELQLAGVSLTNCRFAGATGLADMGLSGSSFVRKRGRVVLAEESDESLDRARLAQLYRSLRRGLEDSKDWAGAADFYKSEMEMRRRLPDKPRAERAVLWAYKWFGGYGVRPVVPLVALLGLVAVATLVGSAFGAITESGTPEQQLRLDCVLRGQGQLTAQRLRCDPSSATISSAPATTRVDRNPAAVGAVVVRSSLGFSRTLDDRLRLGGQWLIVATRLLGAALLAFLVLGLRSIVRR